VSIPTRQHFDEWLTLATTSVEVPCELPDIEQEILPEHAKAYLFAAWNERSSRCALLSETPVWTWLSTQREFQRAVRLIYAPRSREPLSPVKLALPEIPLDKRVDDLFARATSNTQKLSSSEYGQLVDPEQQVHSEVRRRREVRHLLTMAGDNTMRHSWAYDSVFALAEYFANEASKSMLETKRGISASANALRIALDTFLTQLEALDKLDLPRCKPDVSQINQIRRLKSRGIWTPDTSLFPLNRLDELSAERLYVYRMHCANKAATRRSKTEAIAELMGLEGFRHQYESPRV
jgi:hypothetical protein